MAASYTYTSATTGYSNRLSAIAHTLLGLLVTWNDNRKTRKTLGMLSDRQLNDIGLSRGDIEKITG